MLSQTSLQKDYFRSDILDTPHLILKKSSFLSSQKFSVAAHTLLYMAFVLTLGLNFIVVQVN